MNVALVLVLVLVLVIFAGWLAGISIVTRSLVSHPGGSVMRSLERRQIVVTLKSEQAYRGVLMPSDRYALVLRNTELLHGDGSRVVVDGELIILREDIRYIQRP